MKKLLCCLCFLMSLGCAKEERNDDDAAHYEEQKCVFKKNTWAAGHVFPFNAADKIEIIAYDSTQEFIGGRLVGISHLDKALAQDNISAKITLTKGQTDTLFSIFFDYGFQNNNTQEEAAACYNPRHAIVFYKNDQIIEYLEICFECQRTEYFIRKSQFGRLCMDKWCYLTEYFKRCGMDKNFLKNNHCEKNAFSAD